MFSIWSFKVQMAFVMKSKDVCRWMLKSGESSGSGQLKRDWGLYTHTDTRYKLHSLTPINWILPALCYLQEMNVILSERQLLQCLLSLPQLRDLPLQPIHQGPGSAHPSLLLGSDPLLHSAQLLICHPDNFSVDPVCLLHRCISRALI